MAGFSRTIWLMFSSFLIFCFCFTRLKAREISRHNMRNSENIGHIVLATVRQLMLVVSFYFTELCTGHSAKKAHNRFRYKAHLR